MLDARLLKCAEYIQGSAVCDVGTDHGQLPVYLIRNKLCQKVIACDIRPKPLEAARQNITKTGLTEQIQTILSDGLQMIPDACLTDIVIAGMGGETMIHILETCPWSLEQKTLILQPMTKHEILRKWLYENGYAILQETCVPDGHFLYAIMQVIYTGQPVKPDDLQIYFGKMSLTDPDGRAYAEHILTQLRKIRDGRQDMALSKTIDLLEGALL